MGKLTGRAVVLGASVAGLCAARVLAERFETVLVLDRDDLPVTAQARKRVPQGRQPHLLLNAGAVLLEEWFPGLTVELGRAGAVEIDLCNDFLWHQSGGLQRRPVSGLRGPAMSRPLLEHTVRRRVASLPNVTIRSGATATGLLADRTAERVTGVQVSGDGDVPADLVVDATGRQARTLRWLESLGYAAPATTTVEVGTTYVSRQLRRDSEGTRDWGAAAVIGDPQTRRLSMALPMEDDQWIVMLGGLNGESSPSDETGMLDYADSFDHPAVADLLRTCAPTGPIVTHHFPTNQRRHLERLRRFPTGWLPLGDAVSSFDPIYGQGMTSAALQARALGECLDDVGRLDRRLSRTYFRAVAKVISAPWSIAVGGDFQYGGTRGPKPVGTDLFNRYTDRIVLAGQVDDAVVVRFNEVISLTRSPGSLLAPGFVLKVLSQARHARAAQRRTRDVAAPAR